MEPTLLGLPTELHDQVLSYLPLRTVCLARRTCKHLKQVIDESLDALVTRVTQRELSRIEGLFARHFAINENTMFEEALRRWIEHHGIYFDNINRVRVINSFIRHWDEAHATFSFDLFFYAKALIDLHIQHHLPEHNLKRRGNEVKDLQHFADSFNDGHRAQSYADVYESVISPDSQWFRGEVHASSVDSFDAGQIGRPLTGMRGSCPMDPIVRMLGIPTLTTIPEIKQTFGYGTTSHWALQTVEDAVDDGRMELEPAMRAAVLEDLIIY